MLLALLLAATVSGPADVESLAAVADAVVHAQVLRRSSAWAPGGGTIFTTVVLRPLEIWKGDPAGEIVVLVPGGEVGELSQTVPGVASFGDGEEVVLFLQRGPGRLQVSASLGKMRWAPPGRSSATGGSSPARAAAPRRRTISRSTSCAPASCGARAVEGGGLRALALRRAGARLRADAHRRRRVPLVEGARPRVPGRRAGDSRRLGLAACGPPFAGTSPPVGGHLLGSVFPEGRLASPADRVVGYFQSGPNRNLVLFRTKRLRRGRADRDHVQRDQAAAATCTTAGTRAPASSPPRSPPRTADRPD